MAGKPYPEGVSKLGELLRNKKALRAEMARIQAAIEQQEKHLSESQEDYRKTVKEIEQLMDEMDVRSHGNHGYAARLEYVLEELSSSGESR